MKKVLVGILTVALAMSVCTSIAFASGSGMGKHHTHSCASKICSYCSVCRYTDENGDGICDYHKDRTCPQTCTESGNFHRHHRSCHR
ncbi:MAG: hypothetical protein ACOX8H_07735 [Ruminococcus sp.]|jgi:hypothetical protein